MKSMFILSSFFIISSGYSNEMEEKGCIRINGETYTCPQQGCSQKYSSGVTSKIELICDPMRIFFSGWIYEEMGPFRYIYDKEKYDQLVKTNSAGQTRKEDPELFINADPSKSKDFYDKEPYSNEVLNNKYAEIAGVLWTFQEFQSRCVAADNKNNVLGDWYKQINEIINQYKSVVSSLKNSQDQLTKSVVNNTNSQLSAIQLQIDSYKLQQNFISINPGLTNYNTVLNKIISATEPEFYKSERDNHEIVRYYVANLMSDNIIKSMKIAQEACRYNIKNCKLAADMLQSLKTNVLEVKYANVYNQSRIPSEPLNQSLVSAEVEAINMLMNLPEPAPQYNWKTGALNEMKGFIERRKTYGVVCPSTPSDVESAKAFLTSVGLEASQKNIDTMKRVWNEVDLYVGQPNQRILMFSRIRLFARQVYYWNIKSAGEIQQNITKLEASKANLK